MAAMEVDVASSAAASYAYDGDEANDLRNPDIIQKYRVAAEITNDVLKQVVAACTAGKRVVDLCELGDSLLQSRTDKVYNKGKVEKGVAFPTCISVNHCAGHYSPLAEAADVLQEGDVVKVALGAHIDGYVAQAAHTLVVRADQTQPATGRAADVVCAAHLAAEAALRLLKPGNRNEQVTDAINRVAQAFQCRPVEGVLSHSLKRYTLDGDKVIMNRLDAENAVEPAAFQVGDVFCIDILMSTGEGVTREGEARTTVFMRNGDANYSLKLKASRFLFSEIMRRFPALAFSLRALDEDKRGRLGIMEILNHELVHGFPVLYEKAGELVAHVQFTAMLTATGTHRLTSHPPEHVHSELSIEDEELKALLASSATVAKKKKASKKRKASEAEGDGDAMEE